MLAARRFLATLLLLCGVAALTVGVPAAWAQRTVLDTDRYTEAVAPLIAEPAVQASVTDALVQSVTSQVSVPRPLRGPVRTAVARAVASDAFVPAWETAVRLSHEHALAALRDEGKGLSIEDGTLRVELAPLVEALVPKLTSLGVPGAEGLARVNGTLDLVSSPELERAAGVASAVDRWGTEVLTAAAVLLLAAVLLSPARPGTLVAVGLLTLGVSGLHLVLWRSLTSDAGAEGSHPTARLVVAALAEGIQPLVLAVALAGAATLVLGAGAHLATRARAA